METGAIHSDARPIRPKEGTFVYQCELTAADPDVASLSALLSAADPMGVVSIFVDAQGEVRGTAIDIQNRLSHLQRCVSADGPAERAVALNDDALARFERRKSKASTIRAPADVDE